MQLQNESLLRKRSIDAKFQKETRKDNKWTEHRAVNINIDKELSIMLEKQLKVKEVIVAPLVLVKRTWV